MAGRLGPIRPDSLAAVWLTRGIGDESIGECRCRWCSSCNWADPVGSVMADSTLGGVMRETLQLGRSRGIGDGADAAGAGRRWRRCNWADPVGSVMAGRRTHGEGQ